MKNPSCFPENNLCIDPTEPGSAGNPGGRDINRNAHSREEASGHAPFRRRPQPTFSMVGFRP
jgi:hypothetical protein